MIGYYDRAGRPIGGREWAERLKAERRVAETTLPGGRWISTVWLGLNHRVGPGPPLIFETMVFPRQGDWAEFDCQRYVTETEARAGHLAMVEKWTPHDP